MSKHPGVFRKGPGRGWVYRWREWDPVRKKTKQPTSQEYETSREASLARSRDPRVQQAGAGAQLRKASGGWLGIATVIDKWTEHRLPRKKIGPYHAHEVKRALLRIAELRKWQTLGDITAQAVDEAQTAGECSDHTLMAIKSVLNFARRRLRQPIDTNILLTEPLGGKQTVTAVQYTEDQIAALLARADELGEQIGTLARYLALYGNRPVDAVRLRCRSHDEVNREVVLLPTKSGLGGPHPISAEMNRRLARLRHGRGSDDALFLDRAGKPWGPVDAPNVGRLKWWWRRHVTEPLGWPTHLLGIYRLKDYAISRMDQAKIQGADRQVFTKHLDVDSYRFYEGTNRDRARAVEKRLPKLPAPKPQKPAQPAVKLGNRLGNRSAGERARAR